MCGIAGFVSSQHIGYERGLVCGTMLEALRHRGPDDGGVWCDPSGSATLGHRRLSILELSAAGHQPMVSRCGRLVLVFNGEIYNHLDMRRELAEEGEGPSGGWRGHSDTETLLAAFVAWGVAATLQRAVGMFALALWDSENAELVLARDRMGEKPLYYGWQGSDFLFASELKAVRAHPQFEGELDWTAAAGFLRCNYIQAPATMYRNILKLLPGTCVRLRLREAHAPDLPPPVPYWSLDTALARGLEQPFEGSLEDAVDRFEELLQQAVQLQSVADVKVGAFLSGGIDSSAVVAMMRAATTSEVMTFSVRMPDPRFDESAHAAAVARHLGTGHVEYRVTANDVLGLVDHLSEIWDEPFGDSSQIPTFLVSRLASTHVKVALSGDGGDELFLGYPKYALYRRFWQWRALRCLPLGSAPQLLSTLRGGSSPLSLLRRGGRFLAACRQPDVQALDRYWSDPYRGSKVPLAEQRESALPPPPMAPGIATSAGIRDAGGYLPDDVLVKVDRGAMANGLETRAPFLDHRIVEFALSLPEAYKLDGGVAKRVVRDMLYRKVPRALVDRPKMGFSIPLDRWLKHELRPWCEALIARAERGSGGFDRVMVRKLWSDFLAGACRDTEQVWGILTLIAHYEKS